MDGSLFATVDQRNRAGCLIGEIERMLAGLRPGTGCAVVLRRTQREARCKRRTELSPLSRTGTRAMQRNHQSAVRLPHRSGRDACHWVSPSSTRFR